MNEIKQTLGEPGTLALFGAIVGMLVRLLKTRKMEEWLTLLPVVKPVPSHWLPWLALIFGSALAAVDAKLNGGINTWKDALRVALEGMLAGGFAVAGHETLVKTPERVREYRASQRPPPGSPDEESTAMIIPKPSNVPSVMLDNPSAEVQPEPPNTLGSDTEDPNR